VLANYSMHYYGAEPVSADYFGRFATALAKRIGAEGLDPPFVGMMSQGTSGDQMWMDYGQPKREPGLDHYADAVARYAHQAYQAITYHDSVSLAMAETRLVVGRRVPDAARLAWAKTVVNRMAGRELPASLPEVYAREAIALHDQPQRELLLQAIRIGDLGIAAIPNEVFAITGLKIKAQSPLEITMNIELANGSEGYIPPPEQHTLGGYTTWPARTAALEVQAEPRIVAAVLGLLEQVAEKRRRVTDVKHGPYAKSVLSSKPMAYWRLDEIEGTTAVDSSGHDQIAHYEGGFALCLPGPDAPGLSANKIVDRVVYFAGGRLSAAIDGLVGAYTCELWFWNGLVNDARPITGVLFALGLDKAGTSPNDEVGIDGTRIAPGSLFISTDKPNASLFARKASDIKPRVWRHLAYVRDGRSVTAYLDGKPVITVPAQTDPIKKAGWLSIGGGADTASSFEGKIDEVAIYDRALPAHEIIAHVRSAR
jgi:hypothetical protein